MMCEKTQLGLHLIAAALLDYMVNAQEEQKKSLTTTEQWSKFHAKSVPNIRLKDYMIRINKHAGCSESCYVVALIYMDRAIRSNPLHTLTKYNVHRYK